MHQLEAVGRLKSKSLHGYFSKFYTLCLCECHLIVFTTYILYNEHPLKRFQSCVIDAFLNKTHPYMYTIVFLSLFLSLITSCYLGLIPSNGLILKSLILRSDLSVEQTC